MTKLWGYEALKGERYDGVVYICVKDVDWLFSEDI